MKRTSVVHGSWSDSSQAIHITFVGLSDAGELLTSALDVAPWGLAMACRGLSDATRRRPVG